MKQNPCPVWDRDIRIATISRGYPSEMKSHIRKPDRYAEPPPQRRQKKWARIINVFMKGGADELKKIHRTGTRGRIFAVLIEHMLEALQIQSEPEPIFDHIAPSKWYLDFALANDLKIRAHEFYNPDYILSDGTWLEITLSENTAYKKLFRYGHQAPALKVLWLDEDAGLHKNICEGIEFPDALVVNIQEYFPELEKVSGGNDLINKFQQLKNLKGIIR